MRPSDFNPQAPNNNRQLLTTGSQQPAPKRPFGREYFWKRHHKLLFTATAVIVVLVLGIWAIGQPARGEAIAAYRTSLANRTPAQIHNLRLAVKALQGIVLPPGAEFSFNRTVGSWSADQGYVKAPVSYFGELIPGWGGGVCQASSTLYNAALLAGLEILERHRHNFPVRYVPPGQDAAVAQYNIDLRFRNPYDWPLKIEAEIKGDWVICRIISPRPLGSAFSVEREIREVLPPAEVIKANGSGGDLRWRVVNHGAPGLRVAVYRRVTNGTRSTRTLISEDTYPPMNRLIYGKLSS